MFSVPGKPPTNVSVESTTSTAIQVTWLCADCHQHNSTIGFLISYKLDSSNQTVATVVNRTARHFLISALKKFTNYTIHVSSVTARGIGVASKQVSVRTLEDGENVKQMFLLTVEVLSSRDESVHFLVIFHSLSQSSKKFYLQRVALYTEYITTGD